MKKQLFLWLTAAAVSLPLAAAAQTSATNPALAKALKQYPDADTDQDGVLTMQEARAYLAKMSDSGAVKGRDNRLQKIDVFKPTDEELQKVIELGQVAKQGGPLAFEKGNGLRILSTGHSWVAPAMRTLPGIAAAAGLDGHRQRYHISGGGTGAANAIWLKEFGHFSDDTPRPILVPAAATGQWDVMTWGAFYDDKPEYFTQWMDLCLKHNPEMTFCLQDGWPRFDPSYKDKTHDQILELIDADQSAMQDGWFTEGRAALEARFPGKVRIIPASRAVVDVIHRYCAGQMPGFDCIDEKSQGGKRGIYRDGGHLSRDSGMEQLLGYVYFGMLYKKSPATIEGYVPEGIAPEVDAIFREVAWKAVIGSPLSGLMDENNDGVGE